MGTETPRNGVLAQYLRFIERMTNKNHTWVQQTIGALAALAPLCMLLALAVALVVSVATGSVHVTMALLSVIAAMLTGGGMLVMVQRGRQRMLDAPGGSTADPEPRQNSVRNETCAECHEAAGQDRRQVSDGAG